MKKYLLLGLSLLGSCGVWASEDLFSPGEKNPIAGAQASEGAYLWLRSELSPEAWDALQNNPPYNPEDPMDICFIDHTTNVEGEQTLQSTMLRLICPQSCRDSTTEESEYSEPTQPIEISLGGGTPFLSICGSFNGMQIYLKKGSHVTLNPDHDPITKTISEKGNYECTAYFDEKETQVFHVSIESGGFTIPTHWRIDKNPTPIEEPPLEKAIIL